MTAAAVTTAHVGIGRVSKLNDTVKADIYAKLLYTHQSGDSVILGGAGNGEVYDFDAVNSTRARLGARLSKENGERGTYYAGLAYEYEFDGSKSNGQRSEHAGTQYQRQQRYVGAGLYHPK